MVIQQIKSKISGFCRWGIVAGSFLVAVLGLVVFAGEAKAEGDSGNLNFSVNVSEIPVLQITIPSKAITLNLTPTATSDEVFGKGAYNIEVGTSNPAGYVLNMTTNSADLTKADSTATIPTLTDNGTTGYTEDDFMTNTWGYKIAAPADNTVNYFAMKSSVPLDSYNTTTDSRITNLTFASKVDTTKEAGSYSTTLNFVAVANPVEYIQNLNSSSCTTVAPITVYDERDNTAYEVQRLADGKCWLLDNLALDIVNNINSMNSTNTNASDATLAYLKNGGGTTSDQWAINGVSDNWNSSSSYSAPLIDMTSKDIVPFDSLSQAGSWKVGGYYNYCAASAGSYCYVNGTSGGTSYGDATEDICPKGWRMPTGGASGEYQVLAAAITGITGNISDTTKYNNFRNALRVPHSGDVRDGSVGYQGSYGSFWSSTRYNNNSMYRLNVVSATVAPESSLLRYYGISVRCVLKNALEQNNITTMQGFNSLSAEQKNAARAAMPVYNGTNNDAVYTLIDNRDNTEYHIAKLVDGNVWMLDNLALDIVAKINDMNSTNTNASNEALLKLKNGGGTTSDKWAVNGVSSNWTDDVNYMYITPLMDASYKDQKNDSDSIEVAKSWKYGIYYDYCAARAGSYCYGKGVGTPVDNATEDICPAGWRIPNGGTNGEYQTLIKDIVLSIDPNTNYVGDSFSNNNYYNKVRTVLHAPLSGMQGTDRQGAYGYFWALSSSTSSDDRIPIMSISVSEYDGQTSVSSSGSLGRSTGISIRCLLK